MSQIADLNTLCEIKDTIYLVALFGSLRLHLFLSPAVFWGSRLSGYLIHIHRCRLTETVSCFWGNSSLKLNKTETNHSGCKRRCSYGSFCMIRFAKLLQRFYGASSSISQRYRAECVLLVIDILTHSSLSILKHKSRLNGNSRELSWCGSGFCFVFLHETGSEINTVNTPPIRILQWHSIAAAAKSQRRWKVQPFWAATFLGLKKLPWN